MSDEAPRSPLARGLESSGFRVVTAQDSVDALARFAQDRDRFAVVVTDRWRPSLDGKGVVRLLRRLRPDIPIVFTPDPGDTELPTLELGDGGAIVHKPFTTTTLLAVLHRVLPERGAA